MYELLLKMKKRFKLADWLKMVKQAKEKGKITDQEYQDLVEIKEEEA